MSTVTLQSANRIRVPDRAGELIINRFIWPVTVQTNADKIVVGYLPAGCILKVLDCLVIADGTTPAMNYDLCVDVDGNVLINDQAVVLNTFNRTGSTAYSTGESIGRSDANRAVYLLLNTAPNAAAGNMIVEIACFDPGN